jgi:hypothetical protein
VQPGQSRQARLVSWLRASADERRPQIAHVLEAGECLAVLTKVDEHTPARNSLLLAVRPPLDANVASQLAALNERIERYSERLPTLTSGAEWLSALGDLTASGEPLA